MTGGFRHFIFSSFLLFYINISFYVKQCGQDAEREAVKMQMKLEKTQEEKERLLNSLVEAESVTFHLSLFLLT